MPEAECQHFSKCGGCSLQHLSDNEYYNSKQGILSKIIAELGFGDEVISPISKIGKASRRRADFKISVNKDEIKMGFYKEKSHEVINLDECLVSAPELVQFLHNFQVVLTNLKKPGVLNSVSVTVLDDGLDVLLNTKTEIHKADKQAIISFAEENKILRMAVGENILHKISEPKITFADAEIELPIGAFLQATKAGENAITSFVTTALEACEHVADLYSGCGTYSFPLAKTAKTIAAYEGDEQMVLAMHNAAMKFGYEEKITVANRDLFSRYLKPHELKQFDGIVINPPRNGALPQMQNIAQAGTAKIVMVSCNPQTFKRDAKALVDSGYKITKAQAIDQFYWSDHLEVVASFEKLNYSL